MREPFWTLITTLIMACEGPALTLNSALEVFPDRKVAELASAACDGDLEKVRRALAAGADVNGRGNEGFTPLFWAMNCRNIASVQFLLSKGADPNVRLEDGTSAVWLAATYKDPRFLRALAAAGGSLNGVQENRDTSALLGGMTSGFQNGVWDNYYFALEAGADVNIRYGPMPGTTVAEKAVGLGLFDKALELVERGYKHDLDRLERHAESRKIDESSPQAGFKRLLLEKLRSRPRYA